MTTAVASSPVVSCAWCESFHHNASKTHRSEHIEISHTICPNCLTQHFTSLANEPERQRIEPPPRRVTTVHLPSGERLLIRYVSARGWIGFAGLLLVFTTVSIACGGRLPHVAARTMPSPDGCYVEIWDQPQFRGASDFLNGPRRYGTVRELGKSQDWSDRIRSLRLGPRAIATVWSEEQFRGVALTLAQGRLPQRAAPIAPRIRSINIACLEAPHDAPTAADGTVN
jgi:hypothetical protein